MTDNNPGTQIPTRVVTLAAPALASSPDPDHQQRHLSFWRVLRLLAYLWWKVFAFIVVGNYLPGAALAVLQEGWSALGVYLTTWGLLQPAERANPPVFWVTSGVLAVAAVIGAGEELHAWLADQKERREHKQVIHQTQADAATVKRAMEEFVAQQQVDSATLHTQLASEYGLQPVAQLRPNDYLARYVDVYQPRHDLETGADADQLAGETLRAARQAQEAHHAIVADTSDDDGAETPLGILVIGRPTLGKTRCAWEAMRKTLPDASFVRWPHGDAHPFDYANQQGQLLALWLDDLQTYATEREAPTLNGLPLRMANSRLVIVATCRDGQEETTARQRLGGLIRRLRVLKLADLTAGETEQLANTLTVAGAVVYRAEADGTAGALLLGVEAMRNERYPLLSDEAQVTLKTMKLLRSAEIYAYPAARVCAVAQAVFGYLREASTWTSITKALTEADFVRIGQQPDAEGRRALEPVADVYLEHAIPNYPLVGAKLTDDWPTLQAVLTQIMDTEALVSLGIAFGTLQQGLDPTQPADLSLSKQRAVQCFRAALTLLAPHTLNWATVQNNLGVALREQALQTTGDPQARLLEQAVTTLQQAVEAATPGTPDWTNFQNNLRQALLIQAVMTKGDQHGLWTDVADSYQQALAVAAPGTPSWAEQQGVLGVALREQALQMTGDPQARLLEQAVTTLQQAVEAATPGTLHWAQAQHNLGMALRDQALQATGDQRVQLLGQAVAALRQALTATSWRKYPILWANTQMNLAHLLSMQAITLTQTQLINDEEDTETRCSRLSAARQCALDAQATFVQQNFKPSEATATLLGSIAQMMQLLGCVEGTEITHESSVH